MLRRLKGYWYEGDLLVLMMKSEIMGIFIVASCTLGFFVSGLPLINAMFKKMKLSCCVVLFCFFFESQAACYYMVRQER